MRTPHVHSTAVALLATLACLAIPAPVARAQDAFIATMDVDGSNAFVDNTRQPPSGRDLRILDGNLVRTGADTSALVEIIPEGSVQLNENSAKLITDSFFKGARCFAVRLIAGELFINGENVCFLTNVGAVSGISHSRINIKVDERGTVVTVIEGMAELEGQPAQMQVLASEQLVVLPNGEHYKNMLDPAVAERTAEWTRNYDFDAPPPEKGMSTGAKAALGILGAIVIGTVIHEATDDDDDRDDRGPPAQPSPGRTRPDACCINGRTYELAPGQCRARRGVRGTCPEPRQPYPARQLPPEACCIAGQTHEATPGQCRAKQGKPGACRVVE